MPYPGFVDLYGMALELAEKELEKSNRVTFITCELELRGCDWNPHLQKARCNGCRKGQDHGLSLLKNKERLQIKSLSQLSSSTGPAPCSTFDSIQELRKYTIDDYEIGVSVLSSLLSRLRDPFPHISEHRRWISDAIKTASEVYHRFVDAFTVDPPDQIYIFNGRMGTLSGAVAAAEQLDVRYKVFEIGSKRDRFCLYPESLPHDPASWHQAIEETWQNGGEDREAIAKTFFERRVAKKQSWPVNFGEAMSEGLLPENWGKVGRPLPVFISTEHEVAAKGDLFRNALYPILNQIEALLRIVGDLKDNADHDPIHLYLRVHPYMAKQDTFQMTCLREVAASSPIVSIVEPEAPVDTYAMLQAADRILSFGSSTGIEAVYWGTPSIIARPITFFGSDSGYRPKSHQEVVELITADQLSATDRLPAVKYGYYQERGGTSFKYYSPPDEFNSDPLFHGTPLLYPLPEKASLLSRIRTSFKT